MRSVLRKTILMSFLVVCWAQGAVAQKDKIKNRELDNTADSVQVETGSKNAIRNRVMEADSNRRETADPVPAVVEMPMDSTLDSAGVAAKDSIPPRPKKFYTRVREKDLIEAEARAAALRERIREARDRLADERARSPQGKPGTFSKEDLDRFEQSIALAQVQMQAADSLVSAVRARLKKEGKLGTSATEAAAASEEGEEEEETDDDSGELPMPSTLGGKGALKERPVEAPKAGGKDKIRKRGQEPDVDEDLEED